MKMKLRAELIFIWKVLHLTRFETEAQENSEMAYLPVARAKQLGRPLKKTTSCKKATELPS